MPQGSIVSRFTSDTATIFEPLEDINTINLNEPVDQPEYEAYPSSPPETHSGKVIKVIQSAAELVPVPLLKDVVVVAVKIIELCKVST